MFQASRGLRSFPFLNRLAQQVLDLTVDAAQLVLRPGFELGPEIRVDTKKK
jgi:hypothetical protein